MSANTSLHSNAFNFMGYLQGGVDPRTGQYTVSISLLEAKVNALQGPDLPLALFFSPLNTLDSGYGLGWNLQLSQYDTATQIISAHSGGSFRRTGSEGSRVLMREQKIDDFRLFDEGGNIYRLVHRSGLVERLSKHAGSDLALPVEVYGDKGHLLKLEYESFSDKDNKIHPRLTQIKDHTDKVVLRIDRQSNRLDIHLNPNGSGNAKATYSLHMDSLKRVTSVVLPTTDQASWRYEYQEIEKLHCIKEVHTPTGAHELITHSVIAADHHRVPEQSGGGFLPRVLQHVIKPSSGQHDTLTVAYAYALSRGEGYSAGNNFLGANLTHNKPDYGLDYLFSSVGTYAYGSTETRTKQGEEHKVEREYNRFHLLVREESTHTDTSTRNTSTEITETAYYSNGGYFHEDHAYCQLPGITTRTWKKNVGMPYLEGDIRMYEANGNLQSETQVHGDPRIANPVLGLATTYQWYATGGEGTEPHDPNFFTPRLKRTARIPDPTAAHKDAPTLYRHYSYEKADALPGNGSKSWHRVKREVLSLSENEAGDGLQATEYGYFDTPDQAQTHGRLETETVTLNGKATVTSYCYDCEEEPGKRVTAPMEFPAHIKALQGRITPLRRTLLANEPVLTTFQTVTGWDHKEGGSPEESRQKTMTLTHSLLNGEPVLFEDNNGVRILTQYDPLRRVTEEIVAPDDETLKAERHYAYTLCGVNSNETKQTITDARGVITITYLDGLGRPVRECRDHIDEHKLDELMETVSITYNTFGQKVSETLTDYLPQMPTAENPTPPPTPMPLTNTFAYNSWGKECCVTSADGIQQHKFTEPTGSPQHKGPIEKSWRQDSGKTPKFSGKTEIWLNALGKPVKAQRLLANGDQYAEQRYEYDGLGNCRLHTNERDHTTRFAFDAWDRMTRTTLADGTQVTRDYAEHTTEALPIAIHTGKPDISMHRLGSQTFDGLDRLGSKTTGNQTEQLFYTMGKTHPTRQMSAKGDEISFDYVPKLTESPTLTKTPEGDAEFIFNKTSARLEKALNKHGTRTYEYDWNNRAKLERWSDKQDKPLYTISQGISLHGRLCWQKIDNGPDSTFTYDEFGRPKKTTQGNLESEFHFDTLGQLERVEVLDLESEEKLVTTFLYDDQGKEKKRTFKRGGQPERSITQEWEPGNLLKLRHLEEGRTSLLKEDFTYDERGRLTEHGCSGRDLPRDEQDQEYTAQAFIYDELDNITLRTSTRKDQTQHSATFTYKYEEADYNPQEHDPCQLVKVVYSPARPDTPDRFDYDSNGCQLNDEKGRPLRYDSEKRLLQVGKTQKANTDTYHYDALGHLVRAKQAEDVDDTLLYFEKNRLRLAIRGETQTHLLHAEDLPLGQQQAGDPTATRMFSCTASGSVIADSLESTARYPGYSAYGQRFGALASLLGFNGEYLDPVSGWYLLGRGHRAYNPALMRFQGPDALSPFGDGGINRYAYCQGNPITFSDPTGRASRGLAERGERGLAQRGERGIELTAEQQWMIANQPKLDWFGIMMESVNLVLSYVVAAFMVVSAVFTLGATAPMAAMAVANAGLQTVSFVGSLVYQLSGYTNEAAMQVAKWSNYVGTPLSIMDMALSAKGPKTKTPSSWADNIPLNPDFKIPRVEQSGKNGNLPNASGIRRGSAGL